MDRIIAGVERLIGGAPVPNPSLGDMLNGVPEDINNFALRMWDAGVFNNDLVRLDLAPDPTVDPDPNPTTVRNDPGLSGNQITGNITEGTYDGTQLAILEIFQRIESG